jgi:glucose/arabinose dehydrogenase
LDPRESHGPGLKRAAVLGLVLAAGCGGDSTSPLPSPSPTDGECAGGAPVGGLPALTAQRVVGGLEEPVDLQVPPGDRDRLFVVEQPGRIRIVRNGAIAATFLDIVSRVRSAGEQGLLGLAFHPRYAENGRFFVNYTDRAGDTHISEFRAAPPASDTADPASERELLFVRQPFANHNGGGLAFGNDGRLYIALGDGGSGGDPFGNAQDLGTPLGKILRIDVDAGTPFAVPSDNPFLSRPGAFPALWAYGLRNPWRISFDPATGDLFIGDVGQNAVDEVDVGLFTRRGGENYGWNVMEGTRCFDPPSGCPTAGLTLPVAEYSHGEGCAVTGGYVYRGCRLPGYHGTYFYGDYCTAFIRSFRLENGRAVDQRDWTANLSRDVDALSSFGVDGEGEIYILDHFGEVFRIVPAP